MTSTHHPRFAIRSAVMQFSSCIYVRSAYLRAVIPGLKAAAVRLSAIARHVSKTLL